MGERDGKKASAGPNVDVTTNSNVVISTAIIPSELKLTQFNPKQSAGAYYESPRVAISRVK